jgi:hypothetical protein
MPGALHSDYGHYRTHYRDKSTNKQILATDSGTFENVLAVRNASHQLFVQRIIFNVTTDAAQTLTFQDDSGPPEPVAKTALSPGLGIEIVADFGPQGIGLAVGTNLDVVISAAGLAGQINIEAYEKAGATMTPSQL